MYFYYKLRKKVELVLRINYLEINANITVKQLKLLMDKLKVLIISIKGYLKSI